MLMLQRRLDEIAKKLGRRLIAEGRFGHVPPVPLVVQSPFRNKGDD
jgi:hypothetical protein